MAVHPKAVTNHAERGGQPEPQSLAAQSVGVLIGSPPFIAGKLPVSFGGGGALEGSASDYRSDGSFIRFQYENRVDLEFDGDDSRKQLVWEIIEHRESISKRAVHLLVSFMKDTGVFDLSSIEVFAAKTDEGGDFLFRYTFIADRDPDKYGYTYFEVIFGCREPPAERFWPFKFIVGFH